MKAIEPFALEDFFAEFEHQNGYLNLASSDAAPWALPELVKKYPSLQDALTKHSFDYPDVAGAVVPALRQFCSVAEHVGVWPTNGAAEAIHIALLLAKTHIPHPRLAVPAPSYGAFEGIGKHLEMPVDTYRYLPENGWRLDEKELLRVADQCNVVIVNNPHNPTGAVIAEDFLQEVGQRIAKNDGHLLVDEVFRLPQFARTAHAVVPNAIVIGSLSKVYGLPGLRFGWIAAPRPYFKTIRTLQQYMSLSINSFAGLMVPILFRSEEDLSRFSLLRTNAEILAGWANRHADILKTTGPTAGTTVVLECRDRIEESVLFDSFRRAGILLVPGQKCFAFGMSAWFRLSYGQATAMLSSGLDKIVEVIEKL